MSIPKSEAKRALILDAAATVIAERGDSAPTALIAKTAGVAEGTVFTYFRNKEELLTELYAGLISEAFGAVSPDLKNIKMGDRERLLCIWNSILRWGLSNPNRWKALRLLGLSNLVDGARRRDSRTQGRQVLVDEFGLPDSPPGFSTRTFAAFVDLTTDLIRENPKLAELYGATGFEAMWRALFTK
jgi:AcrR family transcriptional regulator